MTMRKRAGSVLFTAAAAAAVVGMSVGPALAATHLTVRVSHGGKYTATASTTKLADGPVAVICSTVGKVPSSKGTGTLSNATHRGTAPVSLGKVKGLAFNNCTSLGSLVTTTVVKQPTLNADSRTNSKGDTAAIITNVDVNVSTTGCSFTVTGSAPGYYSNKTHTLTMKPGKLPVKALTKARLTISNVSTGNCGGAVTAGQHPTYTASYKISLKRLTIKSS
jgi:hypothetical protein